jgi:hypothetical protein
LEASFFCLLSLFGDPEGGADSSFVGSTELCLDESIGEVDRPLNAPEAFLGSIPTDAATLAETGEHEALPAREGSALKREAVNSGFGAPEDEVDFSTTGSTELCCKKSRKLAGDWLVDPAGL